MICLLVVTDGREDYLDRAVSSALANLFGPIAQRVMYDDTGDDDYREELAIRYPTFQHINGGPRQGFGGAIRTSWAWLRKHSSARFVFHLEQDFTFNRCIDLYDVTSVLDRNPHLVQLALRRQPWNDHETAAGGVVEQHPDAYQQHADAHGIWLEHRLFFTTNPCMYRMSLCSTDWPEGGNSEGHFTHQLLRDGSPEVDGEELRFGYWGSLSSGEAVHHIGHQRAGIGY